MISFYTRAVVTCPQVCSDSLGSTTEGPEAVASLLVLLVKAQWYVQHSA